METGVPATHDLDGNPLPSPVIGTMMTDGQVAFDGYAAPVKLLFHEDGTVTWKPLYVRHRAE